MNKKMLKMLAELSDNLRGEHEAIRDYYKLLEDVHEITDSYNVDAIKADIKEIISDEMNHTKKLEKLILSMTTIKANKS
jgi:rubrerythrin